MELVSLEHMFANPSTRLQVSRMLDSPRGITAINGGDASGKSTTLYSLAGELTRRGRRCHVILADEGMRALLATDDTKDWDVHMIVGTDESWREALDQAPADAVIVAGDFDYRSAKPIVAAAKGGRCILTTIHTPYIGIDASYTVQMQGVPVDDFLETFSCLGSQVLIPMLCRACRQEATISVEEMRAIDPGATAATKAWREVGCEECEQRGTRRRAALQEMLFINDTTRPVFANYLGKGDLRNPLPAGHVTLQDTARLLVKEGKVGVATYKREISQNPILRMQHQWELERRRAGQIHDMFSRFVTSQVVDRMLSDSQMQAAMDGERRWVTCMFADIRGFTTLAEGMAPAELFGLLNLYFEKIIAIVSEHGGTIDKFVGDCVMVIFGAPVDQPDHEYHAILCARSIQRAVASLNRERDGRAITMGIGINSGEAMTGCLGSAQRMDYTALGDTINTAARLESRAAAGQIVVGPATEKAVRGLITCTPLGPLALKGKAEAIEAFEVAVD